MDRIEAVKELLAEEIYKREPLAVCIMLYLNEILPGAYMEILDKLDHSIDERLEARIKETIENDEACKI